MGVYSGPTKSSIIQKNIDTGIVTDSLVLLLDAEKGYTGSSVWFDLSTNGYHFSINPSARAVSSGIYHMNFEGTYGAAKRITGNSLSNVPNATNATIVMFSTILNSVANWRTLIRGATFDHQVIIENGLVNLGMYDNNSAGFLDSLFDITSLPNTYTQFNFMWWKLSQSSPYYQFGFNADATVYSITNANATFNDGFCIIGGYHNQTTDYATTAGSSQYWGKIGFLAYYDKHLSSGEISQNYNALKSRFGI